MEPELAPSRHIESITPLSLLAPKLISITSSRCITDIDSLIAWTRKQSPSLFTKLNESLTTLIGIHEALGAIYQKILSFEGSTDAAACMCYIRLLETGEGNEHGDGAAAIAFNVSRVLRACLKTASDQMRTLWSQVNSNTVPEEMLSPPNTYINQMYDPKFNSDYPRAIIDLKTIVSAATLQHITAGSNASAILDKWRTLLPSQSLDLTNSLAKEEPLWNDVLRVMGDAAPLEYERVLNIVSSMHPDTQTQIDRILNEELGLEQHQYKWKVVVPAIRKAEGIVKRNNQKQKLKSNSDHDPPDPILPIPPKQRNRKAREPCVLHQHTAHTTDKCPQILMQMGYCLDSIHGRPCTRVGCK